MDFPSFKTKIAGLTKKFNLNSPDGRKDYFLAKAGPEIEKLKKYLEHDTFIAYLLGKKGSGKGTYSKLFEEAVGQGKTVHFSVGDLIRQLDQEVRDPAKKEELITFLKKTYRGYLPIDEVIQAQLDRSTQTLLPNEFILALAKREIAKFGKKALFIDGFPRNMDQVSYSLFFRELVGYRDDPDVFILINIPENVIAERMKWRRVCPVCQTSRNLKLFPTLAVGYDEKAKEFYLLCDNPSCQKVRMVAKEGADLGLEGIKNRLVLDQDLMEKAFSLHGVPKILLRNSLPADKALDFADDYEITPIYDFEWDKKSGRVVTKEKPWVVRDDADISSVSLLAPPVAVSLIKQLAQVLHL
jgi:adenylate kinase family enzyme